MSAADRTCGFLTRYVAARVLTAVTLWAIVTGVVVAQSTAAPFTTGHRYDSGRREVGTILPDPDGAGSIHFAATRRTYDSTTGLLKRVEQGELATWQPDTVQSQPLAPANWTGFTVFQQTDYTYDIAGRVASEQRSSGGTPATLTQYTYDADGRLVCTAARMNVAAFAADLAPPVLSACRQGSPGSFGPDRIQETEYDSQDRPTRIIKALGAPEQQDYSTITYVGNHVDTITDANGNLSWLKVDGLGRAEYLYFPLPNTKGHYNSADYEQYGYDPNGNRTSFRRRNAQTILYQYDALNRVTLKNIPSNTTADVYYGYDLRGLQLYARFGSATGAGITTTYDGFGRISSVANNSDGVNRTLSYPAHDADGNRLQITHPDGNYFTYTYDGLNRVKGIYEGASTSLVTIAYDAHGRRNTLTRGTAITTYLYDPISRLQTLTHNLDGTTTTNDVNFGFTYSPASQIATRTIDKGAYAFASGSTSQTTYQVNGLNQYSGVTGATSVTPQYDGNANMKFDGAVTYTYDVENRMLSANKSGAITNLGYDPNGRLLTVDSGTASSSTHFLFDGDSLVAEYDSNNVLIQRYVHGPGIDEPLVWYNGAAFNSTTRHFTVANHQGSIIAVTGATTQVNTYDAYGNPPPASSGLTNVGRYQYTGQIWIPQVNLYYYKARIYSPALGRFMQSDPIGYKDDINLYAYVGNDPIDRDDPSGTEASCVTLNTDCGVDATNITWERAEIATNVALAFGGAALIDEAAIALRRLSAAGLKEFTACCMAALSDLTDLRAAQMAERAIAKDIGEVTTQIAEKIHLDEGVAGAMHDIETGVGRLKKIFYWLVGEARAGSRRNWKNSAIPAAAAPDERAEIIPGEAPQPEPKVLPPHQIVKACDPYQICPNR